MDNFYNDIIIEESLENIILFLIPKLSTSIRIYKLYMKWSEVLLSGL